MKNAALFVSMVCASACSSSSPATQAFLEIDAESDARSATTVRLRVLGGPVGALEVQRVLDLEADGTWPLEVSIEPMGGDTSRRWQAQAWALDNGVELGAGEAEGAFTSGKAVTHKLLLQPDTDLGSIPGVDQPGMDAGSTPTGGAGGTGGEGAGGTSTGGAGGQGGATERDASVPLDASTRFDAATDGGATCTPAVASGPCPAGCDRCEEGTCIFDCNYPYACGVVLPPCPAGWACTALCTGPGSCAAPFKLRCADGPCLVHCGGSSCLGAAIECGTGACEVRCDPGSAPPAVDCGEACSCTAC